MLSFVVLVAFLACVLRWCLRVRRRRRSVRSAVSVRWYVAMRHSEQTLDLSLTRAEAYDDNFWRRAGGDPRQRPDR